LRYSEASNKSGRCSVYTTRVPNLKMYEDEAPFSTWCEI
jgi:hypothetical protein